MYSLSYENKHIPHGTKMVYLILCARSCMYTIIDVSTEEPRYNKDLWIMKITHQVSC